MGTEDEDEPGDDGSGSGAGGGRGGRTDTVPHSKYEALRGKFRKAAADLSEANGRIVELEGEAGQSAALTKRIAELERERDSERSGRSFDRAVFGAGISDPEGVDLVALKYNALPEKDRPKPEDWLKEQIGGKDGKGEPAKWLRSYLPAQGGDGDGKAEGDGKGNAGGEEKPPARGAPRANAGTRGGGAGSGAGGGGKPTEAEWAAARAKALSGDRAEFDGLMKRSGQSTLPKFG